MVGGAGSVTVDTPGTTPVLFEDVFTSGGIYGLRGRRFSKLAVVMVGAATLVVTKEWGEFAMGGNAIPWLTVETILPPRPDPCICPVGVGGIEMGDRVSQRPLILRRSAIFKKVGKAS